MTRATLPAELTSFVGRESEIARVVERLGVARLLTLVGPGGVGKTRLAVQVARQTFASHADGVCLVELAPQVDARMVPDAVAAALGIREIGRVPPTQRVASVLRDQQLLLLLDNCEHVLDGCADLAHTLLRECPRLTILATSREPLRVTGEVQWPVPPLSLAPLAAAGASQPSEAVQLFVERARAVEPTLELSAENTSAVADICARLDGLPLPIELAAARVRSIPPRALLRQLESRSGSLALLTGGPRDAPARQRTLRATIAWSYDLLEPEERVLLRRLAPFHGCRLDAVAAVCVDRVAGSRAASVDLPPLWIDVPEALASLVDKSLLHVQQDTHGQAWYVLLETVREFALERLTASPESEAIWRRHAWYYLGLAEQTRAAQPAMRQDAFVDLLEREHANFRAALDWCQAHGYAEASLRLALGLTWFWGVRGHIAEGRQRLEALLTRFPLRSEAGPRALVHAGALDTLGRMAAMQGDFDASVAAEQRSLALYERLEHTEGASEALFGLATALQQRGDLAAARVHMQRSLELLRALPTSSSDKRIVRSIATLLGHLGMLAHDAGDDDLAVAQLEEANRLTLAIHDVAWPGWMSLASVLRDMGAYDRARGVAEEGLRLVEQDPDRRALAIMLAELGTIATLQHDYAHAYDSLARSLALDEAIGEPSGFSLVFDRFAVLASAQGQHARALHLAGAAAALRERVGTPASPLVQGQIDRQLTVTRHALGRLAASSLAAGRQLSLVEAIAETRATDPRASAARSRSEADPLSPREREVAELIGRGQSNRQIAAALVVGEATVATHVQHILAKLELHSRVQIATWVAHNSPSTRSRREEPV